MQRFYADHEGNFIGSYDDQGTGIQCPFENAVEIPNPQGG